MTIKQTTSKMSVAEVESLKERTREIEAIARNEDGLETSLQDPGALNVTLNKNKERLAKDEDLIARGRQKDRMASEVKQIEEEIRRNRPSRQQMEARPGTREFNDAVRLNLAFQKKYTLMMLRLKDLRRRLEPQDPNAGYLEDIRS